MRLMRMIGLGALGYGAYRAVKSYNARSGRTKVTTTSPPPGGVI